MFYERYYHKVGERCIPNNRQITLAMFALAFLTVVKTQAQKKGASKRKTPSSSFR